MKQNDVTFSKCIECSLQNVLVAVISYHTVRILVFVSVTIVLGVGKGDGFILRVSRYLKDITVSK